MFTSKHRALMASFADSHCHLRCGLLNPDTLLETDTPRVKRHPRLTDTQEYLWETYIEDIDKISELAGADPVLLVVAGDWMQGMKYPEQLMSNIPSDQTAIAVAIMEPWMRIRNLKAIRIAQGTGAHDPVGSLTIEACRLLKALYPKIDIEASFHAVVTLRGLDIDYTHYGPHPGSRKWLEGNTVRYNLKDMMLDDICYAEEPPRIYIRAHRHTLRHEAVEIYGKPDRYADMFLLPPSSGMSYHAKNVVAKKRLVTGRVAMEIIDGKYAFNPDLMYKHVLDIRERETFTW